LFITTCIEKLCNWRLKSDFPVTKQLLHFNALVVLAKLSD